MTFHALLSAAELTEDGTGLRATRSIAGQYVIERQARLCRDAGATRIFAYVEGMTDELVSAFDRMRAAGLDIEPMRRGSEIVDRTSSRDGLLVMLDGLIADGDQVASVASGLGYSVLVTDDTPVTRSLERIDAERRWAGLALARCTILGDLNDVPDDWNLVSTVLRRIVQKQATYLPCDPAMFERGDLCVIDADDAAHAMSEQVYEIAAIGEPGLVAANILAPLARIFGPPLLRLGARARSIDGIGLAIMTVAAGLLGLGYTASGAILGLLGISSTILGRYIGLFTLENERAAWLVWISRGFPVALIVIAAIRLVFDNIGQYPTGALVLLYALAAAQAAVLASHITTPLVRRMLPDPSLGLIALAGASLSGQFLPVMAATALVGSILVLIAMKVNSPDR